MNTTDQYGTTPLMIAVKRGMDIFIQTLIELGADVNPQHVSGKTASDFAHELGNENVVDALLPSKSVKEYISTTTHKAERTSLNETVLFRNASEANNNNPFRMALLEIMKH